MFASVRLSAPVPFAAVVGAVPGRGMADALEICRETVSEFPQACSCIVERARDFDVSDDVLERLVANETAGIPISVFQAYGQAYIGCIEEAVLNAEAAGGSGPVTGGTAAPEPASDVQSIPASSADDLAAHLGPAPKEGDADGTLSAFLPGGLEVIGPDRAPGVWGKSHPAVKAGANC